MSARTRIALNVIAAERCDACGDAGRTGDGRACRNCERGWNVAEGDWTAATTGATPRDERGGRGSGQRQRGGRGRRRE